MIPDDRPAALVKAWTALGAPVGAPRCLLIAQSEPFELARAVSAQLKPRALTVQTEAKKPPRARFTVERRRLNMISERFELVLVTPGVERGGVRSVVERMKRIRALMAPGGVIALSLPTLSHPGADQGELEDRLLFPHLERGGARTDLPASAWLSLLHAARFDVGEARGYAAAPPPKAMMLDHGPRLAVYDAVELATPRLDVLATIPGGEA